MPLKTFPANKLCPRCGSPVFDVFGTRKPLTEPEKFELHCNNLKCRFQEDFKTLSMEDTIKQWEEMK